MNAHDFPFHSSLTQVLICVITFETVSGAFSMIAAKRNKLNNDDMYLPAWVKYLFIFICLWDTVLYSVVTEAVCAAFNDEWYRFIGYWGLGSGELVCMILTLISYAKLFRVVRAIDAEYHRAHTNAAPPSLASVSAVSSPTSQQQQGGKAPTAQEPAAVTATSKKTTVSLKPKTLFDSLRVYWLVGAGACLFFTLGFLGHFLSGYTYFADDAHLACYAPCSARTPSSTPRLQLFAIAIFSCLLSYAYWRPLFDQDCVAEHCLLCPSWVVACWTRPLTPSLLLLRRRRR